MYKAALLALLTASAAVSANRSPLLVGRQTLQQLPCSASGEKDCGADCIPLSYTCCPDASGGCPVGTYCSIGSNGQYSCCENGKDCTGPGGAITNPGNTITESSTETIPAQSQTSTQTLSSTSTSTSTTTSVATLTSKTTAANSPPPLPTYTAPASNLTGGNPTVSSPAAFTGAAESNLQSFSPIHLLALVLPFLAA